ncbi:MAG: DPP IV N-terminal domain-containing protein, partial [Calditrichota bacterium]
MSIRNTIPILMLLLSFSSFSLLDAQEEKTGELAAKKMLTVEDANRLAFAGFMRAPRGIKWMPGGRYFTHIKTDRQTRTQQLWKMDANTGKEVQILSSADLKGADDEKAPLLTGYGWEPDGKGIVLKSDMMVQRYRLDSKKLETIYSDTEKIELVQQSPTGDHFAFVKHGDLYTVSLNGDVTRLTEDGNDTVLNGKLDWVYQEELVGRGQFSAYFWSPDGKHIAYLQFDQTPVPHYPLVDWEPYQAKAEMMRYPKAGDPNSIVKLGVVSAKGGETTWLDTNAENGDYFPRVYWLPSSDEVAYFKLDRRQQNLEFVFAKANGKDKRVVIKEKDEHWINVEDYVHFLKDKEQFLWGSERSGYFHLYLYDYKGKQKKQLTSGEWFVDKLAAVNEERGEVYFTSTKDDIR